MYIKLKDNILRLYISVGNLEVVKVADRVDCLPNISWCHSFGTLELIHKDSSFTVLHQQKQMVFIVKMRVQFNDVGVVQSVMDLELSGELLDHIVRFDFGFKYFLDCEESPSQFMFADVDISKFPWSNTFAQLEIFNG